MALINKIALTKLIICFFSAFLFLHFIPTTYALNAKKNTADEAVVSKEKPEKKQNVKKAALESVPDLKELPMDLPVTPSIIHNLKHPQAKRLRLELTYSSFIGDKFLNSNAALLEFVYHRSEKWAFALGGSYITNSIEDEARLVDLLGAEPFMHNPNFYIKSEARYYPIYGKLLIGSYIQHFRWYIGAGVHVSNETVYSIRESSRSDITKLVLGPNISTGINLPVLYRFSALFKFDFHVHDKLASEETVLRKNWIFSTGLAYLF